MTTSGEGLPFVPSFGATDRESVVSAMLGLIAEHEPDISDEAQLEAATKIADSLGTAIGAVVSGFTETMQLSGNINGVPYALYIGPLNPQKEE
jgi:hypothetical protein